VRKARAGARDEERAGGRRQGGKETAGGCSDPVGCGRRDRGAGRETPRVSRKASWELRFETQCWAGFFFALAVEIRQMVIKVSGGIILLFPLII